MNARYATLLAALCLTERCIAGDAPAFLSEATATLQTRNYYFQRNYSDIRGTELSKAEEWAQGFIFNFKSGYTSGSLGLGVDATATLGINLDSGPGRVGVGLLPVQDDGHPADEYSRVGLTFKARLSNTELRVGELFPDNPLLTFSDIRLLPPSYQGISLSSTEFKGLKLQGGHLNSTSLRNEAGDEKLIAMLGHIPQRNASSDAFNYVGGDYTFTGNRTTLSGWIGQLEDIYRQTYLGVEHKDSLGSWSLAGILGLYDAVEDGAHLIGDVDNRALHGMVSATKSGHTFSLGYQRMFGETAFPRVFANIAPLSNELPTYDFSFTDEISYQLKYRYHFVAVGIPGLALTARYVTGDNVKTGRGYEGKDTERDLDLSYVVQSGSLQGLGIRIRNAAARSNYRTDIDEYRIIFSYSWDVL